MKELEFIELQEVTLQEVISFSKLDTSPAVTILDDLNYGLFNQLCIWADSLKLIFFIIKDTHKVALIGNQILALAIAKRLQLKSQVMYKTTLKPRKILGKMYTPKRKDPFVVKAFNEYGKEIDAFIDTNVENVECNILSQYIFRPFKYAMKVRGAGNNKIESNEKLKLERKAFLKNVKI